MARADGTVVLGIDVGTTSAKTGALDLRGARRGGGEAGYPLAEPRPGWAEQDPGQVLEAMIVATRKAAGEARAAGLEVAAISCSAAMHALVALDAGDEPLTPLMTWADMRSAPQAERLREEHPSLHGRTGTPLHPMSPLCKAVWMREREPALHARARRWAGIKELVLHRLTGEWVVDHSVASGTGLLELGTLDWCDEALELAGIRREALAELVPATRALALSDAAARELDLPPGLPVVAGAGDGPLANLGLGAVEPGVAGCSIGTSGALRLIVDRPVVDEQGRLFCYALLPGRWVVGGAINNGGSVLQWAGEALAPDLGPHAEEELLKLAAEVPAGCDGLIMSPALLSERAPHWTTNAAGAYVGLTRHHHRGHLVRAAVEGVCRQLALVLASLRDAGNEVGEIRATGGFARSALWRQILADVLDMPIGFPGGHEGSGFGAALLAMEALDLGPAISLAAEVAPPADVVDPDPGAVAVHARLLPLYAGIQDALDPTFRELRALREETGGHVGQREPRPQPKSREGEPGRGRVGP